MTLGNGARKSIRKVAVFGLLLSASLLPAWSFSLLGPLSEWMTPELGYASHDKIGGPMQIGEAFRWNLPQVTYGFDQTFLDYFGERGVAAVESAIYDVNHLPTSAINQVPRNTIRVSAFGDSLGLIDVKSAVLSALLEQMGLAQAVQNTFVLRDIRITTDSTNSLILHRNFDPNDFAASEYVNGYRYVYEIAAIGDGIYDAVESLLDLANNPGENSIAGSELRRGEYCSNLTQDDVGGLRYLYSASNLKIEKLPPNVIVENGTIVDSALRGGRPIKFLRHPYDAISRTFQTISNTFADVFIGTDGSQRTQSVTRTFSNPDILFSTGTFGFGADGFPIRIQKTPASRWINHARLNSATATDGPGVIPPGSVLSLNMAPMADKSGPLQWGTFSSLGDWFAYSGNGSTLPDLKVVRLEQGNIVVTLTGLKRRYTIMESTNLSVWSGVTVVSNVTSTTFTIRASASTPTFVRALEGSSF